MISVLQLIQRDVHYIEGCLAALVRQRNLLEAFYLGRNFVRIVPVKAKEARHSSEHLIVPLLLSLWAVQIDCIGVIL